MLRRPVHWCEGMLILPHHLQADQAYLQELNGLSLNWLHGYAYGIRKISIHEASLGDHILKIPALEARLRDGTLVDVPTNARLPQVDLSAMLTEHQAVYVFIGLGERAPGQPIAGYDGMRGENGDSRSGPATRYLLQDQEWEDQAAGGNPRPIQTGLLNPRILLQTTLEGPRGYESLPICKVTRGAAADGEPRIDPMYIPPLLDSNCWDVLREEILATIVGKVGGLIKRESNFMQNAGGWEQNSQADIRRRLHRLGVVNGAYPYFVQLAAARGVHPFLMYTELCRLAGQLSIFRADWHPAELPLYDHDDLGRIFRAVMAEILARFDEHKDAKWSRYPFQGRQQRMEVVLDPRWLEGNHELFIGVESDLPPRKLDELFNQNFLDFKIGSSINVEQIFINGESGLQYEPLPGVHPVLPQVRSAQGRDVRYYKIDQAGPYWKQVETSRTLGLCFNRSFLAGDFDGKKSILVAGKKGNRELTFYLYVVEQ